MRPTNSAKPTILGIVLGVAAAACGGVPDESETGETSDETDPTPAQTAIPTADPAVPGAPAPAATASPSGTTTAGPGPTSTPTADPDPEETPPTPTADPTAPGDPTASPAIPVPPPVAGGCVTDVGAGLHDFTCDGLHTFVSVPDACLTTSCGLVIDIHGGTMSAEMENNNTGMRALGEKHGYIVVQPQALSGGVWQVGSDDGKVFAAAEQVAASWHVDAKRVHVMGFSQGGYMSWRFICAHSELLASAAPAAAAGDLTLGILPFEHGCTFAGAEVPKAQIPILYMHGTKDALVNIQQGLALRDTIRNVWGFSTEEPVSSDPTHVWTRYKNPGGDVFEFIQHEYSTTAAFGLPPLGVALVGHCYPGSSDLKGGAPGQLMAFACQQPAAFNWGEAAMQFFIAHPKP